MSSTAFAAIIKLLVFGTLGLFLIGAVLDIPLWLHFLMAFESIAIICFIYFIIKLLQLYTFPMLILLTFLAATSPDTYDEVLDVSMASICLLPSFSPTKFCQATLVPEFLQYLHSTDLYHTITFFDMPSNLSQIEDGTLLDLWKAENIVLTLECQFNEQGTLPMQKAGLANQLQGLMTAIQHAGRNLESLSCCQRVSTVSLVLPNSNLCMCFRICLVLDETICLVVSLNVNSPSGLATWLSAPKRAIISQHFRSAVHHPLHSLNHLFIVAQVGLEVDLAESKRRLEVVHDYLDIINMTSYKRTTLHDSFWTIMTSNMDKLNGLKDTMNVSRTLRTCNEHALDHINSVLVLLADVVKELEGLCDELHVLTKVQIAEENTGVINARIIRVEEILSKGLK